MPRERFRVIWNSRAQETYNLFARLPQRTAQRLGDGQVAFLPLGLQFEGNEELLFVSFNGGFIEGSNNDLDVIELPRQLMKSGLETNTHVWVERIPMPLTAKEIHVDPMSCRDWELLEEWSSQLEDLLLQQVTVVYPGQTLSLRVGKGNVARVQVQLFGFKAVESSWEDETLLRQVRLPCLCLKSNTSVIVSPKPRQSFREPRLRLVPCRQEYNESMELFAKYLDVDVVHVPPFSAAVHPETLNTIPGHSQHLMEWNGMLQYEIEERQARKETAIARLFPSELVPKDAIAVHPLIRLKLQARLFVDQLVVRILEETELTLANIKYDRLTLRPIQTTRNGVLSTWRQPDVHSEVDRTLVNAKITDVFIPEKLQLHLIESEDYLALPLTEGCACRQTLVRVDYSESNSAIQVGCLARLGRNAFRTEAIPENISRCPDVGLIDIIPDISIIHEGFSETLTKTSSQRGFAIHGQAGVGKTHLALLHAAVAHLKEGCGTIFLDCRKLRETRDISIRNILQEFFQVFEDATKHPSCTVILDNVDQIVPSIEATSGSNESSRTQQINHTTVQHSKLLTDALVYTIGCARLKGQVRILATCESPNSIPPELTKVIGDENAVSVPHLSPSQRDDLFTQILRSRNVNISSHRQLGVSKLTQDYRARDIRHLALRVAKKLKNDSPTVALEFNEVLKQEAASFVPSSQTSASVESTDFSRSWTEIGGLCQAKQALLETIIRPSIYRRIYANSKVRQPKGILLYGPPGNGKTYIVPALAKECGYRLITCRGPELLDKYIGASEANVRNLFSRAASVAPSILFLDELDALAPRRGSDNTGVTDRIVNQLLTFLDGVEDVSAGTVYIVAATSRPDKVDPALLRPGRLETHIYFGYPSLQEIEDIVSKIAMHYTLTKEAREMIRTGQFDYQQTKRSVSRLSPADFKGAFDRANVATIRQALVEGNSSDRIEISAEILSKALNSCQPSLSEEEYERLVSCYSSFRGPDEQCRAPADCFDKSGSERKHLRIALK